MTRALKYLEAELNNPTSDRYTPAKYRAGTIHHRLGSLLHNAFRMQVSHLRSSLRSASTLSLARSNPLVGSIYAR